MEKFRDLLRSRASYFVTCQDQIFKYAPEATQSTFFASNDLSNNWRYHSYVLTFRSKTYLYCKRADYRPHQHLPRHCPVVCSKTSLPFAQTVSEMRDLQALLESQVVDQNTVKRALELNGTVSELREENDGLRKANEELKEREEALLLEFNKQQQALVQAEAETKRLKEELHRQQVSLDSVFNDLEESKATIIKLRKERLEKQFGPQSDQLMKEGGQAELLAPAVGKAAHQSAGGFFSGLAGDRSAMQRKIYSLERDNLKLKSELVRLQAQYREESYLNRNAKEAALAEDHSTVATVRMGGSVCSPHPEDSDSSMSSGELSPENGHKSLTRSDSIRRIKEYKDRKVSLAGGQGTAGAQTGDAATVRQPQRIGSLRSSLPRGSLMIDSGDDDRPTALRGSGSSLPPRRIQSLWPSAMSAGASVPQTETAAAPSHVPRRIQSFQPAHADTPQVNLHDLAKQEPSRPPLFGRSQSTVRRMGWWGQ